MDGLLSDGVHDVQKATRATRAERRKPLCARLRRHPSRSYMHPGHQPPIPPDLHVHAEPQKQSTALARKAGLSKSANHRAEAPPLEQAPTQLRRSRSTHELPSLRYDSKWFPELELAYQPSAVPFDVEVLAKLELSGGFNSPAYFEVPSHAADFQHGFQPGSPWSGCSFQPLPYMPRQPSALTVSCPQQPFLRGSSIVESPQELTPPQNRPLSRTAPQQRGGLKPQSGALDASRHSAAVRVPSVFSKISEEQVGAWSSTTTEVLIPQATETSSSVTSEAASSQAQEEARRAVHVEELGDGLPSYEQSMPNHFHLADNKKRLDQLLSVHANSPSTQTHHARPLPPVPTPDFTRTPDAYTEFRMQRKAAEIAQWVQKMGNSPSSLPPPISVTPSDVPELVRSPSSASVVSQAVPIEMDERDPVTYSGITASFLPDHDKIRVRLPAPAANDAPCLFLDDSGPQKLANGEVMREAASSQPPKEHPQEHTMDLALPSTPRIEIREATPPRIPPGRQDRSLPVAAKALGDLQNAEGRLGNINKRGFSKREIQAWLTS
jgi:hypothetical protein